MFPTCFMRISDVSKNYRYGFSKELFFEALILETVKYDMSDFKRTAIKSLFI